MNHPPSHCSMEHPSSGTCLLLADFDLLLVAAAAHLIRVQTSLVLLSPLLKQPGDALLLVIHLLLGGWRGGQHGRGGVE